MTKLKYEGPLKLVCSYGRVLFPANSWNTTTSIILMLILNIYVFTSGV